jgi:hypothetical protein
MRFIVIKRPGMKASLAPVEKALTLPEMQGIVGGYVEQIFLSDLDELIGLPTALFCNEEGFMLPLEPCLAWRGAYTHRILGPVFACEVVRKNGDEDDLLVGLSAEHANMIGKWLDLRGAP